MLAYENMIVFDLETTGTNPAENEIIEIGAIKIKNNRITDTFSQLIKPSILIPEHITGITGIDNHMVAKMPDITSVIGEFIKFCDEDVILGHNIMFDYRFMKTQAVKHNLSFEKSSLDTLKISRKALAHLPSKKLTELCKYYNIAHENAHRATDDAKVTYELFCHLRNNFELEYPKAFIPEKIQWAPKKQSLMTKRQREYLESLLAKHRLRTYTPLEEMTKSEASRIIDNIILKHGK